MKKKDGNNHFTLIIYFYSQQLNKFVHFHRNNAFSHIKMDISTLVVLAICLYLIFLIRQFFSHRKYPPGPFGLPFFGYIPFLSRKPYLDLQRLAKTYGNVFRYVILRMCAHKILKVSVLKYFHAKKVFFLYITIHCPFSFF